MEDASAGGEPAGGTTAVSVELAQLIEQFPEEDERILEAFLSVKGNVNDAIAHYKVSSCYTNSSVPDPC